MRRRNKKISIYLLVALVLCISIGFAILSTNLSINGTTSIKGASWDVHFENIQPTTGSVTPTTAPNITDQTTVNYSVTLTNPGDFYEFTVDVVNGGSIDAMIDTYTIIPTLTAQQKKYLEYTVKYNDGSFLGEKDTLAHDTTKTLRIRIEYKEDLTAEDLPNSDQSIDMSVAINYIQADDEVHNPKMISLLSGDGTHIGDEVAIGDEYFYVIGTEGSNTKLFAKYNLLVGYRYEVNTLTPLTNPTGRQSKDAIGWNGKSSTATNPWIAIVPFSENNYWDNEGELISTYGSEYPAYVYDNNASISTYVNNYKSYLEGLGVTISSARLISYSEILAMGCEEYSCADAAPWTHSSTYWSGTAEDGGSIWDVGIDGEVSTGTYNDGTYGDGVRPVILIPTSSIS